LVPSSFPAYAASPDPARLSIPWPDTPADMARPMPTDDPGEGRARRAVLAQAPELRPAAAPFFRLSIPDPFEVLGPLRYSSPPPDRDPPAVSSGLPPKPRLAEKPSAKPQ
jgi:hypothetical protein